MDIAKPSYTCRLQDIWGAIEEDEADEAAVVEDAEAGIFRHVAQARAKPTIKLMRRDGRKVRPFSREKDLLLRMWTLHGVMQCIPTGGSHSSSLPLPAAATHLWCGK